MSYVELKEKHLAGSQKLSENLSSSSINNQRAWHLPIFFKSAALTALLFFLVIDLCVRVTFHPDVYQLPNHSFIWWSVADYRRLKHIPETLIFGSSLMLAVVNDGDATYLNRAIDSNLHHQSFCLKDYCESKVAGTHSNFSFAVGGQMASDVYAIAKTLIHSTNSPKLIIWGIAPRDFVDAAFREPISSDTAKYMNKISQTSTIPSEHTSLPFYIEKGLVQISNIFARKEDFVSIANEATGTLLRQLSKTTNIPQVKSLKVADRSAPPRNSENRDGKDLITSACTNGSEHLLDNAQEYRTRYIPFRPKSFNRQLQYYEKFLDYVDALKVKVLLVNMPLTSSNISLMPPGIYSLYLNRIKRIARNHSAQFYDFNDGNLFSEKDFLDPVHLNGKGGEKFVQILSSRIKVDHSLQ